MNLIEFLREKAVRNLFLMKTFNDCFPKWRKPIEKQIGNNPDFFDILNLGDSLRDIFKTTGVAGRTQGSISGGGVSWEGLVCWYLNLCLVGSRSVIIKHSKKLIPSCVADAITVNYGSYASNTESDLIAITFPNESDFMQDITNLQVDEKNYLEILDKLSKKSFNKLSVGIIQCKTNWNDNAQIPMLWEIVYSSTGFENKNITIGRNGYSMKGFHKFFYSFITVPSNNSKYDAAKLSVKRVHSLSGGNYWGQPSQSGVAHSIKEIFNKKFTDSWVFGSQEKDVQGMLQHKKNLDYFNLSL